MCVCVCLCVCETNTIRLAKCLKKSVLVCARMVLSIPVLDHILMAPSSPSVAKQSGHYNE